MGQVVPTLWKADSFSEEAPLWFIGPGNWSMHYERAPCFRRLKLDDAPPRSAALCRAALRSAAQTSYGSLSDWKEPR
jgi:hypothetical protein